MATAELAIDVRTIMPHCETCKWWGPSPAPGVYEDLPNDWGRCDMTSRPYFMNPEDAYDHPESLAKADCGDSVVETFLRASPQFGCLQWEARE